MIALLCFIAIKLGLNATGDIFHHNYGISPNTSLLIVMVVLAIGVLASMLFPAKEQAPP